MKSWYSTPIEKVRVAGGENGGNALTIEQAEAFRDQLTEAIEQAKRDAEYRETETERETAERHQAEAESAHEAKLDRRRERHFDERGHF